MALVKIIKIYEAGARSVGTVVVTGDLTFGVGSQVILSNSNIWGLAGQYVLFTYTGACTTFSNLTVTTTVTSRSVSSLQHDTANKRIIVTLV